MIFYGRVVLLGDFNSHSPKWNVQCWERKDTTGLERLVNDYDRILSNEPEKATQLTLRKTTIIIDLIFTTLGIGVLDTRVIDEELSKPSDYEVIVGELADLDRVGSSMSTSQEITGWGIKEMSEDSTKKVAKT